MNAMQEPNQSICIIRCLLARLLGNRKKDI